MTIKVTSNIKSIAGLSTLGFHIQPIKGGYLVYSEATDDYYIYNYGDNIILEPLAIEEIHRGY